MNSFTLIWPGITPVDAIAFRLANITDAAPIAILSRELIEYGLRRWAWNPTRVLSRIRDENALVLVAEASSQLAGFGVMIFGPRVASLELLAVHPEFRRRGIGRCLVKMLERSANALELNRVKLEVRETNTNARAFYYRLNYRETDILPQYYSGTETAVCMIHHLNSRNPLPENNSQPS